MGSVVTTIIVIVVGTAGILGIGVIEMGGWVAYCAARRRRRRIRKLRGKRWGW